MKQLGVLALAVVFSGCSVLFVENVHTTGGKVECTESMQLPLVDAAVGVVGLATPFILEAMRDRRVDNPNWPLYVGLWGAGAVGAVSSVIGVKKVKRCRREREAATLTAPAPATP